MICQRVIKFKNTGKRVLGLYKFSNMGTQKWHLLDSMAENVQHVGSA